MTVHVFPGLRADSLLTYLAALGLTRVVGEQADPCARTWWEGDVLRMETTVEDVPAFLVTRYEPVPAVSPWNGGSGFQPNDKNQRAVIDRIVAAKTPRLAAFERTVEATRSCIERLGSDGGADHKRRLVVQLRNWLPEEALAWLDAVVVVGDSKLHFPSVYGTGGNDGRLEFSANFHQRLLDVIPELGAKTPGSMAWARDALFGDVPTPQRAAPAGQYDPLGAGTPGTVAVGSARALVNPWLFVLMVEACGYLAASAVRAAGRQSFGYAAVPFTVAPAAAGETAGSDEEDSRGEFWAPLWANGLAHRELRQVFDESRASWAGRTPASSAGMYAAVRSHGVDARVSAFMRYAIVQRNGLAFVAALRDRVAVNRRPGIDVAVPVEARMNAFLGGTSGRAGQQTQALTSEQMAYLSTEDEHAARDHLFGWLAALTAREHAVALSDRERSAVTGAARQPRAWEAVSALRPWLTERAEHRLAAAWASAFIVHGSGGDDASAVLQPLSTFLVGRAPGRGSGWLEPVVPGFRTRPLDTVLADVVRWREVHGAAAPGAGRGMRLVHQHHYECHPDDVELWVAGELDERRLERALAACLALDWTGWGHRSRGQRARVPDPVLAPLAAMASCEILLPGFPVTAAVEESRQGWQPGWTAQLCAGRVAGVVAEATAVLTRSRLVDTPPSPAPDTQPDGSAWMVERRVAMTPPLTSNHDARRGTRLAAALLAPVSSSALTALRLAHIYGRHAGGVGTDASNDSQPVLTQINEGASS